MDNIELIKNDKYVSEFLKKNNLSDAFINEHINLFLRVINSRKQCANCRGLKECLQNSVGERLALSNDGTLIEEIEYCDHMLNKLKTDKINKNFVYNDIPEDLRNIDLNNIEVMDDEKGLFIQLFDIYESKTDKGLYISGNMGVGKTYLCIALANSLAKNGEKVGFVNTASFINEMRKLVVNEPNTYDSNINKLKKVKYLILDDLGSESVSTFSRDDILFTLLDYRMANNLITIFTSNLDKNLLSKHYAYDKKDNCSLMMANRLVERIDILGKDFVLSGSNKRRK